MNAAQTPSSTARMSYAFDIATKTRTRSTLIITRNSVDLSTLSDKNARTIEGVGG